MNQRGRDVDTVEDVSDVMQNAGCHLRLTGLARRLEELRKLLAGRGLAPMGGEA